MLANFANAIMGWRDGSKPQTHLSLKSPSFSWSRRDERGGVSRLLVHGAAK
jgi:hypothetical protein